MRVNVRFAEPFWRAVGQRDLELEIKEHARVRDLLDLLEGKFPALAQEMARAQPYIFIDEQEAAHETNLQDGARVHIVWPVAGG